MRNRRRWENRLLEPIYKIFGEKYVEISDSAEKLYETHSIYEKEKLFVLINEASGVANFENSEMLKRELQNINYQLIRKEFNLSALIIM
jgi:hypothetical protein